MKVLDYLDKHAAQYGRSEHRPTFTAQQMAAQEHVPGMYVAKPVVIKADDKVYMCVLPACCKIDLDALKASLGVREIDLATEKEMAQMFPDCSLGAEPPIGGLYGLTTIMDSSLETDDYIVFQAGTHEQAIKMPMEEYVKLVHPCVMKFSYHLS